MAQYKVNSHKLKYICTYVKYITLFRYRVRMKNYVIGGTMIENNYIFENNIESKIYHIILFIYIIYIMNRKQYY